MTDDARTIGLIYEALFEPSGWDAVAKALADAVRGSSCFILEATVDGSSLRVLSGRGLEAAGVPEYQDHFHRLDIWKDGLVSSQGGRTAPFHELVPQSQFQNSEIFNDWVKPALNYEVYWGLGHKLDLTGNRVGLIGVHRPRRGGEMGPEELRAVDRFIPHLGRALRLRRLLDHVQAQSSALAQICDSAPNAAMLVDERGRLNYANLAASNLLRSADGLSVDRHGALRATQKAENDRLHRRIAGACGMRLGEGEDKGPLRIERREAGPLLVTVAPVPAERFSLNQPLAILCVEDPWGPIRIDPRKIALSLGVTASEARLVAALAGGGGLRQAAGRLGIAYNTARTQLRSVLDKSGMHSQAELMLRVGRLR